MYKLKRITGRNYRIQTRPLLVFLPSSFPGHTPIDWSDGSAVGCIICWSSRFGAHSRRWSAHPNLHSAFFRAAAAAAAAIVGRFVCLEHYQVCSRGLHLELGSSCWLQRKCDRIHDLGRPYDRQYRRISLGRSSSPDHRSHRPLTPATANSAAEDFDDVDEQRHFTAGIARVRSGAAASAAIAAESKNDSTTPTADIDSD